MSKHSIVFGLRHVVQGEGFVAGVAVDGRALVHEAEDSVWVESVNPGGFSATGSSITEAITEFRRAHAAILFDIAAEATRFASFREQVERLFEQCSPRVVHEWERAAEEVREGRVPARWLPRRPAAECPVRIRVQEIRRPSSRNNEVEPGFALVA